MQDYFKQLTINYDQQLKMVLQIIRQRQLSMYFRNMKGYQSMNCVHTTSQGTQLWLGDYYAATDLKLLKEKKITAVLTAAAMLGVAYPATAGINHKIINAFDLPTYKMTPHFQQAFQFIKGALQNGNILVHCAAGISRSTTFVLVYLMREKGFALNQGIQYVRSKRPIINPNYGFLNQLSRFEQQLKKGGVKVAQKAQKTNGFAQKQQKTVQQIQQQKNAFINFVKRESAMNKTTGSYVQGTRFKSIATKKQPEPKEQKGSKEETAKNKRGQSVNYRKTMNNQAFTPTNLTFKLQHPKIVTIKK